MAARNRKSNVPWETNETRQQDQPQTCSISGKNMYANEREAKATAAHRMATKEAGQAQLRAYKCPYCGVAPYQQAGIRLIGLSNRCTGGIRCAVGGGAN